MRFMLLGIGFLLMIFSPHLHFVSERWEIGTKLTGIFLQGSSCMYLMEISNPGVPDTFGVHYTIALMLTEAAGHAVNGYGGPIRTPWWASLGGVFLFLGMMIGQVYKHGHAGFFRFAHQAIYSVGFVLSLSSGIESLLRLNKEPASRSFIAQVRSVVDPAMFGALGVLTIVHQHDTNELTINYHTILGLMMITLGFVILMCSLIHSVADWHHPACRIIRLVHTFAWLMPAGWLMQMSFVVYAGDFGVDRWMEENGINAKTASEEIGTCFSFHMLTSSLVFLVLASARSPGARESLPRETIAIGKYTGFSALPNRKLDDIRIYGKDYDARDCPIDIEIVN
jgi:hypothetical protein